MEESTQGSVMMLDAAAGFGTIGIFGELAVAVGFELVTLLSFRCMVATVLVPVVATVHGWSLPWSWRDWAVLLGLGVVYAADAFVLHGSSIAHSRAGDHRSLHLSGFVVVLSIAYTRMSRFEKSCAGTFDDWNRADCRDRHNWC